MFVCQFCGHHTPEADGMTAGCILYCSKCTSPGTIPPATEEQTVELWATDVFVFVAEAISEYRNAEPEYRDRQRALDDLADALRGLTWKNAPSLTLTERVRFAVRLLAEPGMVPGASDFSPDETPKSDNGNRETRIDPFRGA
jgi:hypothetical protein